MENLVIGANGQLGTELRNLFDENSIKYTATDAKELDITDRSSVMNYFEENTPKYVFHCAAFTAVDAAEEEPGEAINQKVNVEGTKNVAEATEKIGATLIYISTDYVFDGNNNEMYTENDQPNPKNEYGRAKYEGEKIVAETMSKYYTIRTSWVFGQYGKNFVFTMLNLAKTHDKLTVVNDQVGRPTWTRTLAEFMLYAVQNIPAYGLYQLSNDGECSWYEFASEILKDTEVEVLPVTSEEYPQKAYRPKHSVMDLSKTKSTGFKIIDWKEALSKFLENVD
ncbi:dTDP-4-dehydrorhamnose reductase [Pediococcus pentosaceus]|uniref:dTDP-4-dehydrorhamnose reductase n=1 Tax=Pediococcus pentosaceus TaxID=1255 RepID=A0AA40X945_PEDPE|nr:dTDP-4-dehydrorhamnose reductase [Pediococcus pentosaceus]MBF7123768.1 dTDP-4-dehydrorhamnose reductase [Pediococcus pentosaceus]MBF7127218.1 dTDP-4-dehydrorhamnose reductase [Pediococcus pentosaceus]MCR1860879.1 dTDP-4-dehydrorhamnose reductase [Pediococcus pentosaceus]